MDAKKYKIGWPFLEGTPLCIINEPEGEVYSAKQPLGAEDEDLSRPENYYVFIRNILSLFPAPLRGEVTEVIMDLESTFHIKTFKDDSNKKYLHLKSLLALAFVHPYCEAFEKLQGEILEYLNSGGKRNNKASEPVKIDMGVQTEKLESEDQNKNICDKDPPKKEEKTKKKTTPDIVTVSDDDSEFDKGNQSRKCAIVDMKRKKKTYLPHRALVPDAVQVDVPLIYNPAKKHPCVYAPNSELERKVVRLASVEKETMKVILSDEYVFEESFEPVVNKDGLPNIYVPGKNGDYKIVRPQILTLTIPGMKDSLAEKSANNTSSSLDRAQQGIPKPPPLRDPRGQIAPNPLNTNYLEPGEVYSHPAPKVNPYTAPNNPVGMPLPPIPIVPQSNYDPMSDPHLPPLYGTNVYNPVSGMMMGQRLSYPGPAGASSLLMGNVQPPYQPGLPTNMRMQVPVMQNMPMSVPRDQVHVIDPHVSTVIVKGKPTTKKAVCSDGTSKEGVSTFTIKRVINAGIIAEEQKEKTKKEKKRKRKSQPVKFTGRTVSESENNNKPDSEDKTPSDSDDANKKDAKNKPTVTEDEHQEETDNKKAEACEKVRKSPRQLPKHPVLKFKHSKMPIVKLKGFKQKGQNLAQLVKKIKKVNNKRLQSGSKLKPVKGLKLKSPQKRIRKRKKVTVAVDDDEDTEGASDHDRDEREMEVPEVPVDDIVTNAENHENTLHAPLPTPTIITLPSYPTVRKSNDADKPLKVEYNTPSGKFSKKRLISGQNLMALQMNGETVNIGISSEKTIRCCPHSGCNQHFDTSSHARLHANTHVLGKTELKCPKCDMCFPTLRWFCLLKHLKETHEEEHKIGEFGCYLCGLDLETQEKLDEHFSCHYCNRYKCVYCGCKIFVWPAMQTHLSECQVKEEGKQCNYGCPYCHVVFRESHYYKAHIKSHHDNKFRCIFCWPEKTEEQDNWQKLRAHYTSKHKTLETTPVQSEKKVYSCEKCGRQYVHLVKLQEHIKSVHGDPQYKCDKCEKVFRTKQSRTWHEEFAHGSDLKCPQCDYVAKTKVLLKLHHRQIHDEKRHLCHECGKSFAYFHQLKVHNAKHARQKKHDCKLCNKQMESYLELRQHMFKEHPASNKPVQSCQHCEFKCYSKTTLKIHLKKVHPDKVPEEEKSEHSYSNKKDEPTSSYRAHQKKKEKKFAIARPSIRELKAARTAKFKEQMAHLRALKREKTMEREQSCARTRSVDDWKRLVTKKEKRRKNLIKKWKKKQAAKVKVAEPKGIEFREPQEERPMRRERKAKRKAVAFIEEVNAVTTGKVTLGDYERPKYVVGTRRRSRSRSEDMPSTSGTGTRRSARMQSRYESENLEPDASESDKEEGKDVDWSPKLDEETKKSPTELSLKELTENFLGRKIPEAKPKYKRTKQPPKPKKEKKPKPEKPAKRPYRRKNSQKWEEVVLSPFNYNTLLLDHNYCKMPEIPKLNIVEAPDVSEFAECTTSPEMVNRDPLKINLKSMETSPVRAPRSLERSPRSQGQSSPFRSTLRTMLRHSLSQGQGFTKVSPGSSGKYTTLRIKSGSVQHIESEVDKLLAFVQSEIPNMENVEAIDKTLTETFGEQSSSQETEGQLPDNFFPSDIGDLDDIVLNEADFKLLEKLNFDQGVNLNDIPHVQEYSHTSPQPGTSQGSISPQASKSIIDIIKNSVQKYQSSVEQNPHSVPEKNLSDQPEAGGQGELLPELSPQPQAKSTVPDIVIKVPSASGTESISVPTARGIEGVSESTNGRLDDLSLTLPSTSTDSQKTEAEEVASTLLSLGTESRLISPVQTTRIPENTSVVDNTGIPEDRVDRKTTAEPESEEQSNEPNTIAKQAAQLMSILKSSLLPDPKSSDSEPPVTSVSAIPATSGPAVVVESANSIPDVNLVGHHGNDDVIVPAETMVTSEVHSTDMDVGADFVLATPTSAVPSKEVIERTAVVIEDSDDDNSNMECKESEGNLESNRVSQEAANVDMSVDGEQSYSGALTDHGYF